MRGRQHKLRVIWAPSLLRRLLRNRYVQATAVLLVGVICALSLAARVAALDTQRRAWGQGEQALLLVDDVAVGEMVASAVEIRELPKALVPEGAMGAVDDAVRAKVPLYAGEVLLSSRVTGQRTSGLAASTVAMTLPVVAQVPLIAEGDLVDLWAVDSANFTSQRVASNVVVLAFSDRDVTVAVPEAQVPAATVASLRPVTITLVG